MNDDVFYCGLIALVVALIVGAICLGMSMINTSQERRAHIVAECGGAPGGQYADCRQRVLDREGW